MSEQVKAVLDALELSEKYYQGFLDNDLDDKTLRDLLDITDFQFTLKVLENVILSTGHRINFLKGFLAIKEGSSSTSGVKVVQETPRGSSFPGESETLVDQLTPLTPEREPGPVQIMDFEQDPKGGSPKIMFFEDSYQRVVEKSGNRPISVLTIAGPSNKGKSVFLNFVLRYLKAKKEGTIDWMGWRDPLQPLKGFSWGNGDVVTKGIWMWSEPISYNAKGQDVDVYIMDTQGVYDESIGSREWSILVGLSMLTSSMFIFNIAQDLQEDSLQFFKSFLSFGLYALQQDGSEETFKPFQKLVFLIRDWEKFNEYPYGGEGGLKYIDKKLECKEKHSDEQRRVRQQMTACFEDIDCYLFPYPGEEARDVSFQGAVSSTPKFRQFVAVVEACIGNLLDEANLPVKKLQGNLLAGGDLLALFKSYTELLNAEESPSAESFYSSSMHNCNAAVVRQCLDTFKAQVESAMTEYDCLDDDDLGITLEDAERTALTLFDKLRKMGDEKNINDARSRLTDRIEEISEVFRSQNKVKNSEIKIKVDEELKLSTQDFNTEVESKLFGRIVTPETLQKVHSEAFSRAKSTLQKVLKSSKLRPTIADAALEALKRSTDLKAWEKKTEEMNKSIEADMENLMSTAQSTYLQAMSPEHFTSVDDFWKADAKFRSSCLTKLSSSTKLLDKTTLAVYEDKLATKLEASCDIYLRQLNKRMDELKEKIELFHGNCIQVYSSSMDKMLRPSGENPVNVEKLAMYNEESVSAALKDLKSFYESIRNQLKDAEESVTHAESRLIKDLAEKYKEYQQRNKSKRDNFEATARNYVGEAKDKYRKKIREAIENVFDEEDYIAEADNIKATLTQDFMQKIDTNLATPEFLNDSRQAFSTFTASTFADYLDMFRLRQEEDHIAVEAALLDARKHYRQEMEKKFKAQNWFQPESLRSISSKLCIDVLSKCNEDVELSERQQAQLLHSLNSIFLEYEERNFKLVPSGSCAIGIDLGTTYSCVGVYMNGKVEILTERESKTVPSYVAFNDDRGIVVGESAKDLSFRHPENTIFDAKRLIGRKFDDPIVQQDIKLWPFTVTHENNQPRIQCRGQSFRPEEISARVLSKLKQMAQDYLSRPVTDAVVTVPAYFNDAQRQATKDAAEIAGLKATIITEPVAAAIAYGVHHSNGTKKNVLVFDLGGGTFDVAVLEIKGGEILTRSINGDTHLGGEDFDNDVLKHLMEITCAKYGVNLEDGKSSTRSGLRRKANARLRRLRAECEKRKRDLSFQTVAEIFQELSDVGIQLKETLTRSTFEEMISARLNDCMTIVDKALTDARLEKSEVDDIVLVGGSTKIPKVRKMLAEYFDGREISYTVNPDEAVAVGAAIRAAVQNGKQATGLLVNVTDVTPMSIGIENTTGEFVVQIARNTCLPASVFQHWVTAYPNQTEGEFRIFEGEEKVATANNFLGQFDLTGIPPAPPGVEPLDVTTVIDAEGIVTIEATCRSSKSSNQIKILTYKGRMSKSEIQSCLKTDLMRW